MSAAVLHRLDQGLYSRRMKANVRRRASYAVKVGRIKREPCAHCGDPNAEKHHPDYGDPLAVVWLCSRCHGLEQHRVRLAGQDELPPLPPPRPVITIAAIAALAQARSLSRP